MGGTIQLDLAAAREAIRRHIAEPLGISVEKAAYGISTIVNLNMVNGIRRVSIERGYDPRDFALVCAGGAAGMHISALAEEMGIDTVLIPKVASGLCAFGQVISDVKYNYLSTEPMRLDDNADLTALNRQFNELEQRGIDHLESDGFDESDIRINRSLELRYVGQIHECTVEVDPGELTPQRMQAIVEAFHQRHEALFTYSEPHNPVELVNLESTLTGHVSKPNPPCLESGTEDAGQALVGRRDMVFGDTAECLETPVYAGEKLLANNRIEGPAVIEEATTTLVVRPGWQATLETAGSYRLNCLHKE